MIKCCSLMLAASILWPIGPFPQSQDWETSLEEVERKPQIDEETLSLLQRAAEGTPPDLKSIEALDAYAGKILQADILYMRTLFTGDWEEPLGAGTTAFGDTDLLVAVWQGFTEHWRRTFLWDHPDFNLVLLEVDNALLQQPRSIIGAIESVIGPAESRLDIVNVALELASRRQGPGLVGGGHVFYSQGPARALKGYELRIVVYRSDSKSFIGFRSGKRLAGPIYEEGMVFVPERFPPLSQRLGQVDKLGLMAELGGGPERDAVLLDELIRRGIEKRDFQDIMLIGDVPPTSRSTQERRQRVRSVLGSIRSNGRQQLYQEWIRDAIRAYAGMGDEGRPMLKQVVTGLRGMEEVDYSGIVIGLMRDGMAIEEGLSYFLHRGGTVEELEALSTLTVPPKFESYQTMVLETIKSRIQLKQRFAKDPAGPSA